MSQLLFLELNEVCFKNVSYYCERGLLPNFSRLFREVGWCETSSERVYEHLEPWIQWVTAHTGLTFAEHNVFRLGDIVNHDIPQIWEQLEQNGVRVGAVSPMNAKHRVRDPAFFIPDPWTPTAITAPPLLRHLYSAVCQAVNENSTGRITPKSLVALGAGLARYARPENYSRYLSLAAKSLRAPWAKALFLDLLLADVFLVEVQRTMPGFGTLFLNAAAHIQHHYMFSSACYSGDLKNPDWYVRAGGDPLYDAYELYDHVIGLVRRRFPAARIMIATGLHQVPHRQVTYYWRLKNHAAFLRDIEVPFTSVGPRMSRDFLISCPDEAAARIAADRLRSARADDGLAIFEVDNRGKDLFVMLTYPREITRGFAFQIGDRKVRNFDRYVSFVALKNGEHCGTGYFVDTGLPNGSLPARFPLAEIYDRVLEAFGISPPKTVRDAALCRRLPTH